MKRDASDGPTYDASRSTDVRVAEVADMDADSLPIIFDISQTEGKFKP